jgi:hypothetical protein
MHLGDGMAKARQLSELTVNMLVIKDLSERLGSANSVGQFQSGNPNDSCFSRVLANFDHSHYHWDQYPVCLLLLRFQLSHLRHDCYQQQQQQRS